MVILNEKALLDELQADRYKDTLDALLFNLQFPNGIHTTRSMSKNQACRNLASDTGVSFKYIVKMSTGSSRISDVFMEKLKKVLSNKKRRRRIRKQFIVAVNYEDEEARDFVKNTLTNKERADGLKQLAEQKRAE